jgi:hypothetical protein
MPLVKTEKMCELLHYIPALKWLYFEIIVRPSTSEPRILQNFSKFDILDLLTTLVLVDWPL